MALEAGARLGPYEILAPLGAGGMGEVYEARDTRLDRTVAVKILPDHLAVSTERKARFEREARLISQLSHPHICTLHDVGSQDGVEFLVMEHIEGETLAAVLKRGPLPLDRALEYGTQIAEALDRAHRQGVVHRDLKPGNVMLTRSGVKLLDFGLAKLVEEASAEAGSQAPTQQKELTGAQEILGTLAYMAPEQLEGKDVDGRADLFAFGAVLYEMLTGARAFTGESRASLITAIMSAEPEPVSALRAMTPPALDHVVRTCLAKDPEERWQSAGDVSRQVRWIAAGETQLGAQRVEARRGAVAVAIAAGVLLGAAAVWSLRPGVEAPAAEPSYVDIALPGEMDLGIGRARDQPLAISPDGRRIAFATVAGGPLYVRDLSAPEERALSGTEGATNPFFSPDGEWVAYRSGNSLWKVSAEGGVLVEVTRLLSSLFEGGAWPDAETIVLAPRGALGPLYRVSADGGEAVPLTTLEPDERGHSYPTALPDGKGVVFRVLGDVGEAAFAAVASLESGEHRRLFPGAEGWTWFLAPGHLVYGSRGGLWAVALDVDTLEVRGGATPVLDDVMTGKVSRREIAHFSISQSGSLLYVPGGVVTGSLVWVDRQGRSTPISRETGFFRYPALSPDGERLAVHDGGDLWLYDVDAGTRRRLTARGGNFVPHWSPDGSRLVFGSSTTQLSRGVSLHQAPADDASNPRLLLDRAGNQYPIGWTPDGRELLFFEIDAASGGDILALSPRGR